MQLKNIFKEDSSVIQFLFSSNSVSALKSVILLNIKYVLNPTKQTKSDSGREPKLHHVTEMEEKSLGPVLPWPN